MLYPLAQSEKKPYLCSRIWKREAGASPAQSRCCNSYSRFYIFKSLTRRGLGRLKRVSDKSEDLAECCPNGGAVKLFPRDGTIQQ